MRLGKTHDMAYCNKCGAEFDCFLDRTITSAKLQAHANKCGAVVNREQASAFHYNPTTPNKE